MKEQKKQMVVASIVLLSLMACSASVFAADCLTCNQPVTAYYGAAAPVAAPCATGACATGACAPVAVSAYRPAYQPLFSNASARRYDRLMRRWNRFWSRNEPAAMGAPVAMTAGYGSACSPCATTCYKPQQCCRYVPQTCYRTEYCNVPVTTYRPVTTCDPCTGCTTTCMKPCTTYQRQARRVPYTTYRMVCETRYTPVVSCNPCCNPCGLDCCASGSCATGACATGNCATGNCATGNCATGNCATGNCATVSGTVGTSTAAPSVPGQSTPQPTLSPSAVEANKPGTEVDVEIKPQVEIQPMRDLDSHQPTLETGTPTGDRMALVAPRAAKVSPVSNQGGWRASSR